MIDAIQRYHRRYVGQFRSEMRFPTFAPAIHEIVRDSGDPIRYTTLALAIERLKSDGIEGDFAELGVWRGDTSCFLHFCAPDRILHLFDTFSGFPEGLTDDKPDRFNDTSLEVVKRRFGSAHNVQFHIGRFPETTVGLETNRFAFVMLDGDCYATTHAGLEYFYPLTPHGGFIFMHDFNSPESNYGVSRAVYEFLRNKPEQLVEIPDPWGSAVFRKIKH